MYADTTTSIPQTHQLRALQHRGSQCTHVLHDTHYIGAHAALARHESQYKTAITYGRPV